MYQYPPSTHRVHVYTPFSGLVWLCMPFSDSCKKILGNLMIFETDISSSHNFCCALPTLCCHENNTAQQKAGKYPSSTSHFPPFNCCLLFCSLKIYMLCFVLINSIPFNLLCIWILYCCLLIVTKHIHCITGM